MNCRRTRRRLLASERPNRPSVEIQSHLDDCADCRAWHERFLTVERQLSLLPVAPSAGKDRLLHALAAGPSIRAESNDTQDEPGMNGPAVRLATRTVPARALLQERGLRKVAIAFALAATVAAFAVGLWTWPQLGLRRPGDSPATAYRKDLDRQRAERFGVPGTGRERVESLLKFEESLKDAAMALARGNDVERLDVLIDYYRANVEKDLFEQTDTLSVVQRRIALERAERQLRTSESELSYLLSELQQQPARPEIVASLRSIIAAADGAHRRCRQQIDQLSA